MRKIGMIMALALLATIAQAQQPAATGEDTVYLTPSVGDQRSFGLVHDPASTSHICTAAGRSVQVALVPGQPPQSLQIVPELKDDAGRYCKLTVTVRGQDGKILFQTTENFSAMQGVMSDVTIAVHKFGTQQRLIIGNNAVSNNPISTLYIPRITANGAYNDATLNLTSGERISFAFSDGRLTVSSKFFDGTTGDREPSCCFTPASFDLTLDQRGTRFSPQGNKIGLDLYRQLTKNGERKPGNFGPLASDQTGDTHSADITPVVEANGLGLQVSEWQTYWIYGLPNDAGTAFFCVPAVSFKITNDSDHDLDAVQISAAFLDEAKKETFGAATKFWSETSGDAPLPPGYSRTINLHSSRGFVVAPYSCTAASRPAISVRVQAKSLGTAAQATLGASQVASEMRNYQTGQ